MIYFLYFLIRCNEHLIQRSIKKFAHESSNLYLFRLDVLFYSYKNTRRTWNTDFFTVYGLIFFLSRIYWSSLDHDLMASIWEKGISILAGNLNSGRSQLITAVPPGTLGIFGRLALSSNRAVFKLAITFEL